MKLQPWSRDHATDRNLSWSRQPLLSFILKEMDFKNRHNNKNMFRTPWRGSRDQKMNVFPSDYDLSYSATMHRRRGGGAARRSEVSKGPNLFATILSTMYHCLPFLTRELNKGRNSFKPLWTIVYEVHTYARISFYFFAHFQGRYDLWLTYLAELSYA